jgi:hypothetical protein
MTTSRYRARTGCERRPSDHNLTREAQNQLVSPNGTPGPLFAGMTLGGSPPSAEARARIAEFARANHAPRITHSATIHQRSQRSVLLVVDLTARLVLFVVDLALLGLGDVPAVRRGIRALLGPDRVILAMELLRLLRRQLATLHAVIDPAILIRESIVDLFAPWVVRVPVAVCEARRGDRQHGEREQSLHHHADWKRDATKR